MLVTSFYVDGPLPHFKNLAGSSSMFVGYNPCNSQILLKFRRCAFPPPLLRGRFDMLSPWDITNEGLDRTGWAGWGGMGLRNWWKQRREGREAEKKPLDTPSRMGDVTKRVVATWVSTTKREGLSSSFKSAINRVSKPLFWGKPIVLLFIGDIKYPNVWWVNHVTTPFWRINLPIQMYVCLSICLSVCLSVCMYVCMYVCLSKFMSPVIFYWKSKTQCGCLYIFSLLLFIITIYSQMLFTKIQTMKYVQIIVFE